MPLRTSSAYIEAVRKIKNVYVLGNEVRDVTTHPATAGMVKTMASIYDLQREAALQETLTCTSELTGSRISMGYMLPRSKDDLYRRSRMIEFLAFNFGGGVAVRLPEYMGLIILGMLNVRKKLCRQNPRREKNLVDFYLHASEEDLALTHAFSELRVNRAAGRALPAGEGFRVVSEGPDGVVITGARGVATLAPFCDELFGWNSGPGLPQGRDAASAPQGIAEKVIYFSHPVGLDGTLTYCREPAAPGRDQMDRPLASRFDELDSYTFYDGARIPEKNVYMKGDIEVANIGTSEGLRWGSWHVLVRQSVKAQLFVGVAAAIAEYLGTTVFPNVQDQLSELVIYTEALRSFVIASIERMSLTEEGYACPDLHTTIVGRTFTNMNMPRMLQIVQELSGSSLIMAPTKEDLSNKDIGPWLESSFAGVKTSAENKVKLFKLAWDLTGSDYAGRQVLFELFNFGTLVTNRGRIFNGYDFSGPIKKAKAVAGITD